MIQWQELIATSRLLTTTPDPNSTPLQGSLRRAVSTAYYAMFHALAASNAECLKGTPQGQLSEHAWLRAYRGLDHTQARRSLEQRDRELFSTPVQGFINTFSALQDARHTADYDPSRGLTMSETLNWVDRTQAAIEDFTQVSAYERRAVSIQTLIRRRTS